MSTDEVERGTLVVEKSADAQGTEGVDGYAVVSNESTLRQAYEFLKQRCVPTLPQIASKWRILQSGANKDIFVARVYVFIHAEVSRGTKSVKDILEADFSSGYSRFVRDWTTNAETMAVPALKAIREAASQRTKPPSLSKKVRRG